MKSQDHPLDFTSIPSPIGYLKIAGDDLGVTSIKFFEEDPGASNVVPDTLAMCAVQLKQYFEGKRKTFDVKLRPQGTDFQMNVWNALLGIPFGAIRSYKDVALALKKENAIRAVGAANGQNRLNIIIPCHRVIGSNGDLTGYGGELWRKKWLLEHERAVEYGKQQSLF
jgi:methylated-DNA-[protein]-cysteine S-methyltransferase